MMNWISVDERLPEVNEPVTAFGKIKGKQLIVLECTRGGRKPDEWMNANGIIVDDVTHWMADIEWPITLPTPAEPQPE